MHETWRYSRLFPYEITIWPRHQGSRISHAGRAGLCEGDRAGMGLSHVEAGQREGHQGLRTPIFQLKSSHFRAILWRFSAIFKPKSLQKLRLSSRNRGFGPPFETALRPRRPLIARARTGLVAQRRAADRELPDLSCELESMPLEQQ